MNNFQAKRDAPEPEYSPPPDLTRKGHTHACAFIRKIIIPNAWTKDFPNHLTKYCHISDKWHQPQQSASLGKEERSFLRKP